MTQARIINAFLIQLSPIFQYQAINIVAFIWCQQLYSVSPKAPCAAAIDGRLAKGEVLP